MKRQALLAFCWFSIIIGAENKKIVIRLSDLKDSVSSASNTKSVYSSNPLRYYSLPPKSFQQQATNNIPATVAPGSQAVFQRNNVVVNKDVGYFQDSNGNKYYGLPQITTYKSGFPQKIVSLNNLPLQISQPFASPSQTLTIKQGFDLPQYSYGNIQSAPLQYNPSLNAFQYGKPQTLSFAPFNKGPSSLVYQDSPKPITVPLSGKLKATPEFDIFGQGLVDAFNPYGLQNIKQINGFDVYGRGIIEQHPASSSNNQQTNPPNEEHVHHHYEHIHNEEDKQQQNAPQKDSNQRFPNLEHLEEPSHRNGPHTDSHKGNKKSPKQKKHYSSNDGTQLSYSGKITDGNLNEPLYFENPIVPQVQHYLPQISYHAQRIHQIPFEAPQPITFRSGSLKEAFIQPTPIIVTQPIRLSSTPLPSPTPTVAIISSSSLPPTNLRIQEPYQPIPYEAKDGDKPHGNEGQHRQIIIQEEIPPQKIEKEEFKKEIKKEEENSEEDFEKGYKDSAQGFPGYEKQVNFEDDDDYRKGDYGEPKYSEAYTSDTEDKGNNSGDEQDSASDDEEDYVTKIMGAAYKKAKDQHKQNYLKAFNQYNSDVSDDESESNSGDRHQVSQPYTAFTTSYPKKTKKGQKYRNKSPSQTSEKYSDYKSESEPSKKLKPQKDYSFSKSVSYPLPTKQYNVAQSEKLQLPSKSPFQNAKFAKITFGQPQYHYGFSPVSRSLVEDASVSASNDAPSTKILPDTMKRVYKENWYISKSTSTLADVDR